MTDETKYSLSAGTVLKEKWVILEFIAKGGMGEIYRAHQLNLNRDVAIKVLSKEWLEDIEGDEDELANAFMRFRQEVNTMAQIRHPNVIQIYDFDKAKVDIEGEEVEIEYIVLEYIPGRTLRDTMREDGFYPDEAETADWIRKLFIPVIQGVKAVHDTGIIHRDIKPANVLMDGTIPKIADFGLARSCNMKSMTCSLDIKGSPNYMAPEQFIDFKGTDHRTDIYSLGKILYEAVDGKIPEKTIPFKQVHLKKPETPFFRKIDEIIKKATDEDPEKRFQSATEFIDALNGTLKVYDSAEDLSVQSSAGGDGTIFHLSKRQLHAGMVVAAVLFGLILFWGYHSVQEHFLPPETSGADSATDARPKLKYPEGIPLEITARDGTVMHLVPGGELKFPQSYKAVQPGSKGSSTKIRPFYMDETAVTNQQFAVFLNSILKDISVDKNAVKKGETILLYLGEVTQGYEPIIYADGQFRVKHPGHSSCPVVRVTGYGASAYASFYGRRLPEPREWIYVATNGGSGREAYSAVSDNIKLPMPVMMMPENIFGIRGINIHLGCWVKKRSASEEMNEFAIMGGFDVESGKAELPAPVRRNPWEAFEEVGFRCVKDVEVSVTVSEKPETVKDAAAGE